MTRPRGLALVLLASLVLAFTAVGCPCVDSTINASPWLRWKIFAAYGADRLCSEMTKRGAPLRLTDASPVMGRFFPSSCQSVTNDARQTVTVQFAGDGSAWTPLTRRFAFTSAATVEYRPDFQKDGDVVYVWFRPVATLAPTFQVAMVEQPVVGLATAIGPLGAVSNMLGRQILSSEIARGFTVIHADRGDDFAMGILAAGERPAHPYDTNGQGRVVLANEIAEVHANTLDFLGPFEIDRPERSLFAKIRSSVALDAAVVSRSVGDAWRSTYQSRPGVSPPPSAPIVAGAVAPDNDAEQSVALPPGQYYIVIDNSASVGQINPPPSSPVFDAVARVQYLVSLGDRR